MMKENGREAQAEDISQVLMQMAKMKEEFSDALEEIRYLREQIDSLENQTVKAKMRRLQEEVQVQLRQAQNRTISAKKSVDNIIQNAVSTGKQKGIRSVDKVLDMIPVYQSLTVIEKFLNYSVSELEGKVEKLDVMAGEVHAASNHMKNIGKVMSGKEIQEAKERDPSKGLLAKIEKSMVYCRKLLAGMAVRTVIAKAHIEHFRELSGREAAEVPTVGEIAKKMWTKAEAAKTESFKLQEAR